MKSDDNETWIKSGQLTQEPLHVRVQTQQLDPEDISHEPDWAPGKIWMR